MSPIPARFPRALAPLAAALGLLASSPLLAQTTGTQDAPSGTTASPAAPADGGNPANGFNATGNRYFFQTSVWGKHWHPSPEHTNNFRLLNLEAQRTDRWLYGFAFFRNSFNQPSEYVYFGKQWWPFANYPSIHVKLTAGVLHGYKGEYRDKIPFNGSGVAPAILPSVGWSNKRFATDVIFFGTAGVMWTAGVYIN